MDGFRAEVVRLQGVVTACAASARACSADAVGDDVRVGDAEKGGFEEHWDWLRDALKDAKTAKAAERTTLLQEAGERLEAMGQESGERAGAAKEFGHERAVANAVLAAAAVSERRRSVTWWDRAKMKMLEWLQRLFEGVVRVGTAAPWLGTLLEWVCFVGAAVGLLFFLLRNLARQRLRVALGGEALQKSAWESEAEDWAKWAAEHARRASGGRRCTACIGRRLCCWSRGGRGGIIRRGRRGSMCGC